MFNFFGVILSYTRKTHQAGCDPPPSPRQMREQLTAGVKTTTLHWGAHCFAFPCTCFYLYIDESNLRSGSTFVSLGETFRREERILASDQENMRAMLKFGLIAGSQVYKTRVF